jgi:hypothetical protein
MTLQAEMTAAGLFFCWVVCHGMGCAAANAVPLFVAPAHQVNLKPL